MKRYPLATLFAVLPFVCLGATLPIPTSWHETAAHRLQADDLSGVIDIPDQIYNKEAWELDGSTVFYGLAFPDTGPEDPLVGYISQPGTIMQPNPDLTLGQLLMSDIAAARTVTIPSTHGGVPVSCVNYRIKSERRTNGVIWESPCLPLTWTPLVSCTLQTGDVLLDHGVSSTDDLQSASASITVTCTKPATGRMRLPSGGDLIPLGGGTASLTADGSSLGATRQFSKGPNVLEILSQLNGVTPGSWTSSVPLVLDMD